MSLVLEKLSGLSDRHTLKIQRPWFSSDGQRDVTLGVLKEYFGASPADIFAALASNPEAARAAAGAAPDDLSSAEAQAVLALKADSDLGNVPDGSVTMDMLDEEVQDALGGTFTPANYQGQITALNAAIPAAGTAGRWYESTVAGTLTDPDAGGAVVVIGGRLLDTGAAWLPVVVASIPNGSVTFDKLDKAVVKNIAGNSYLRTYIDRLIALGATVNWDRFDTQAHARVIEAIGDQMVNTTRLCLDRGAFEIYSGSELTRWFSADPTDNDLTRVNDAGFSSAWGSVRPSLVSDGVETAPGCYFENAAGKQLVLTGKTKWMLFNVVNLRLQEDVTFATAVAMNADLAHVHNTVARVTATGQLWRKVGTSGSGSWAIIISRLHYNGPTNRFEVTLRTSAASDLTYNNHGNLAAFIFSGVTTWFGAAEANQGTDLTTVDARHIIAVAFDGVRYRIWLDGQEVYNNTGNASGIQLTSAQLGNSLFAVHQAAVAISDWDAAAFRRVHDALAGLYNVPPLKKKRSVLFVSLGGQSHAAGSVGVSDTWLTANGWNGTVQQVVGVDQNYPSAGAVALGGWQGVSDGGIVRAANLSLNNLGSVGSVIPRPSGGSEGVVAGFLRHVRESNPDYDIIFGCWGLGGATIDTLSTGAPLAIPPSTLKLSAANQYQYAMAQLVRAKEICEANDAEITQVALLWIHGHANGSDTGYSTKFLALYDNFNADAKKILNANRDTICICDQPQYTTPLESSGNALIIQNNQVLTTLANRSARPIFCYGPSYPITTFIHKYARGYRWEGEQIAKAFLQVYRGTGTWEPVRPRSTALGANYVDITFYVPVPPLQFATNANNVETSLTNKGFEYSGGGLTITSVAIQSATVVRINLSGAPASGHIVRYVSAARYGNLCDSDVSAMYFDDQNWSSGVWPAPVGADGAVNDPRNWCVAFSQTL